MLEHPKESGLTLSSVKRQRARTCWQRLPLLSGRATPVLLCTVLGKLAESWQAFSAPGEAFPAAPAQKAFCCSLLKLSDPHIFTYSLHHTLACRGEATELGCVFQFCRGPPRAQGPPSCSASARGGPAGPAPLPVPLKGPSVLLAGRPSVYGMSQLLVFGCVCADETLSVARVHLSHYGL